MIVGLAAIGIRVWLWMNGHRLKSMAYSIVLVALMQILVGASVFLRTETQLSTLIVQLAANPAALKAEEATRMQTVMKNFSIYTEIELVLPIVGVGMIAYLQRHDVVAGIGIGLVLQVAFTLTLDIFAEARGADYLFAIRSLAI